MSRLRGELDRFRAEVGPSRAVGRLAGMLVMLRVHLGRHFALEEENGFLDPRGCDEGARHATEALIAEHRAMEGEIGRLVHATQAPRAATRR